MPISQAVLRLLHLFQEPVTVPGPEESQGRVMLAHVPKDSPCSNVQG